MGISDVGRSLNRKTEYERRAFSDGENLDSIESEKSRILLHEVERGWWILAVHASFLSFALSHL